MEPHCRREADHEHLNPSHSLRQRSARRRRGSGGARRVRRIGRPRNASYAAGSSRLIRGAKAAIIWAGRTAQTVASAMRPPTTARAGPAKAHKQYEDAPQRVADSLRPIAYDKAVKLVDLAVQDICPAK